MAKHTREGPVERIILELIEEERAANWRGRRRGRRRDHPLRLSEGQINLALYNRQRREAGLKPDRSARVATRAAIRRFIVKHPAFTIEIVLGEMCLEE